MDEDEDDDDVQIKHPIVVTVFLYLFMAGIIITNGCVAGLLLWRKRLRKIPNLYVVSLSFSQLLIGTFVFLSTDFTLNKLQHNHDWCINAPFVQLFAFTSAIFSLIGITVDRYRCILQPLVYKPTLRKTIIYILVLQFAAIVYSFHTFVNSKIADINRDPEEHSGNKYCNFLTEDESSDLWFRIFDFVLLLIIPSVAMVVMYYQIIQKLWAKNMVTNDSTQRKRNAVKISVTCVTTFIVCWLPFNLVEITHDAIEKVIGEETGGEKYFIIRYITIFLALSNSILNPIIYGFTNKNFQQELRTIQKRYFCKSNRIASMEGTRNTVSSNRGLP